MVLILDAMGGDHFPHVPVEAAKIAVKKGMSLVLVGDMDAVLPEMKKQGLVEKAVELVDCKEFIGMNESIGPASIKKKSTIRVAYEMMKHGKGDAFVSAGHSGAMMALGMLVLRNIDGVERACITAMLPARKGQIFLADCGANIDCTPAHLLQFGVMSATYVETVFGIKNPKIGLLNIGEEASKGTPLLKEAHQLFKNSDLNFTGNVEGKMFFESDNDIVIAEGFSGNILLKTVQGTALYISNLLREELTRTWLSKLGALILAPGLRNMRAKLNAANYSGAPLLGLRGLGIVCHGSSNAEGIVRALQFAQWGVGNKLQEKMLHNIEQKLGHKVDPSPTKLDT